MLFLTVEMAATHNLRVTTMATKNAIDEFDKSTQKYTTNSLKSIPL